MFTLLLLAIWTLSGVALAYALSKSQESRWAWTPIAAILGPLWLVIAREQQDNH